MHIIHSKRNLCIENKRDYDLDITPESMTRTCFPQFNRHVGLRLSDVGGIQWPFEEPASAQDCGPHPEATLYSVL